MATTSNVDVVRALGKLDDAIIDGKRLLRAERIGQLRALAYEAVGMARHDTRTGEGVGPDDADVVFLMYGPEGLDMVERDVFIRHARAALAPPVPLSPCDVARVALRRVPR